MSSVYEHAVSYNSSEQCLLSMSMQWVDCSSSEQNNHGICTLETIEIDMTNSIAINDLSLILPLEWGWAIDWGSTAH
jgi:hypothetical protein